ncbi:MAG: IS200/IS605 family transposase [Anaerolineae bacterium]
MPYWRLFYHMVWTTRRREPLIAPGHEDSLHTMIAGKAAALGAMVHAVGGIEDHVHLAVSAPPTVMLSTFIGQIKGASSHFANRELGLEGGFAWQAEYGVVSFSGAQLQRIVEYVKRQRQHHLDGAVIGALECVTDEGPAPER